MMSDYRMIGAPIHEQARIIHDTADQPVCWACPGRTCDRQCDVARAARMDADAEAHDAAITSPLDEDRPR